MHRRHLGTQGVPSGPMTAPETSLSTRCGGIFTVRCLFEYRQPFLLGLQGATALFCSISQFHLSLLIRSRYSPLLPRCPLVRSLYCCQRRRLLLLLQCRPRRLRHHLHSRHPRLRLLLGHLVAGHSPLLPLRCELQLLLLLLHELLQRLFWGIRRRVFRSATAAKCQQ